MLREIAILGAERSSEEVERATAVGSEREIVGAVGEWESRERDRSGGALEGKVAIERRQLGVLGAGGKHAREERIVVVDVGDLDRIINPREQERRRDRSEEKVVTSDASMREAYITIIRDENERLKNMVSNILQIAQLKKFQMKVG